MTQEQFNRAVYIKCRTDELNKVKEYIADKTKHRLWYAHNSGEFGSEWRLETEWVMRYIEKLLDKHDLMIREEIDEEIERLEAEIETL